MKNILLDGEWAIEETKMKIKILLESNKSENTTSKYLEDKTEPVLVGNFIAPTSSNKKSEKSQPNNNTP